MPSAHHRCAERGKARKRWRLAARMIAKMPLHQPNRSMPVSVSEIRPSPNTGRATTGTSRKAAADAGEEPRRDRGHQPAEAQPRGADGEHQLLPALGADGPGEGSEVVRADGADGVVLAQEFQEQVRRATRRGPG